jgi:outer membrane protein W
MNNINEDKVQVAQAAPVAPQPVVQPAVQPVVQPIIIETKYEPKEEVKAEKTSKLLPYIGFQAIKGTNIDFESKVNVGATFETKVNSNFTVGLGLGYTSLDATDNANKFVSTNNTYYYYSGTYSSYYPNGRTVNYSKVALSANGKYFLTVDSKFRPYVGAGVDFNRANLSYDSSSNVYINGLTFGGEETSSNYVTALAKIGTEFDLNETVGFNIDFSYSTSFASSNSQTNSAQSSTNPDQNRLENMAQAMSTSNVTAISGGIVVKF